MLRIGVDIGGTFTDFCGWKDGGKADVVTFKVPSTPPNFENGFRDGFERMLDQLELDPGEQAIVFHGTTVSTNAVIERTGRKLALLVTKGYRDILELQRLGLRNPLNMYEQRVAPLVERGMVFEIDERLLREGEVLKRLDTPQVRTAVEAALAAGAEGFVVALLHSYADPCHEDAVAEVIRDIAGPHVEISLSSHIWPRPGEYERSLIAVLNAFVKKRMGDYIGAIERYLAERLPGSQLFVTRSNGGAMAASDAIELPIHTLLSGPASGVTAVQHLGRMIGEANILTMDMGGTSTDISLIRDGEALTSGAAEVGDFPVVMPVTGVEAIGAGGGSIIYMDGGILRVGPRSAGARPGPACFSRGGIEPTLTDAYLLSGYLPEGLLGGAMRLDHDAARRALQPIAEALGTDISAAAEMAVRVASSTMEAGVLPFVARYGIDPEDLTLIVYGGGGALHGPILASDIGVSRIVVPAVPSVFCAYGGLVCEMRHDVTVSTHGRDVSLTELQRLFGDLETQAKDWMARQVAQELLLTSEIEHWAEMRYPGQSFEVDVPLSADAIRGGDQVALFTAFHDGHEQLYSHCDRSATPEFVHLRLRIKGRLPMPEGFEGGRAIAGSLTPQSRRDLYFAGQRYPEAPIFDRGLIPSGAVINGPSVIEQRDATILVPPGYAATTASYGNIIITRL